MSRSPSDNLVSITARAHARKILKFVATKTDRKIFEVMDEAAELIRERYKIELAPSGQEAPTGEDQLVRSAAA